MPTSPVISHFVEPRLSLIQFTNNAIRKISNHLAAIPHTSTHYCGLGIHVVAHRHPKDDVDGILVGFEIVGTLAPSGIDDGIIGLDVDSACNSRGGNVA